MPRVKKYCTKQAKLEAERAKSARHYSKNRTQILARKRLRRKEAKETISRNEADIRKVRRGVCKSQEQTKHEKQLKEAQEIRNEDSPLWRLRNVENGFNREMQGRVSAYLDRMYERVVAWYSSDDRTGRCPVGFPQDVLSTYITAIDRISSALLENETTELLAEWPKADKLRQRIRRVIGCLDDLELAVQTSELLKQGSRCELLFQKVSLRRWLDGETNNEPDLF
ncbi:hypothetical protein VNI00_014890 [Paramarasmius palmivorus]|uniref:Uncharacterized protein n=1 Tax=Paramarasmius palmivorus TaxID=297713 RepID=A0AAW0BP09_9AGAR